MKLMSAVVLLGVMLSVGCAQQSETRTGRPALQSSATNPSVPEHWRTIARFNYPASPPAPQPTVSFQLAVSEDSKNLAGIAEPDTARAKLLVPPYFIFVTGQHGRVEVENISVYSEGTSFGIYVDATNVYVYKFLSDRDDPSVPHPIHVRSAKAASQNAQVLEETSMVTVDRTAEDPTIPEPHNFREVVNSTTNEREFEDLPSQYTDDQITKIYQYRQPQ